jgi:hypothetical protein
VLVLGSLDQVTASHEIANALEGLGVAMRAGDANDFSEFVLDAATPPDIPEHERCRGRWFSFEESSVHGW